MRPDGASPARVCCVAALCKVARVLSCQCLVRYAPVPGAEPDRDSDSDPETRSVTVGINVGLKGSANSRYRYCGIQ